MSARFCHVIALVSAVAAIAQSPASAQVRPLPADVGPVPSGGAFVIQSCGESGSAEGWSETINNAPTHVQTGVDCPPSNVWAGGMAPNDYQHAGLWVGDRLTEDGGDEAVPGDRAELSFTALSGTKITRVRWYRDVAKRSDNSWQQYTALDSSSNIVDTCDYDPAISTICGVGAKDWYPDDADFARTAYGYADLHGLLATRVIAGLVCRDRGAPHVCGNGSLLYRAQVQIFSAFLTIADGDAPTVGTPSGEGWTTNAYVNGTVPVTLSSSDLTGIRETRAYVDGKLVAMASRSCSYTRPRPCTDEPGGTVDVPTAGLGDGPHELAVGAVDAAGNETKVTRSTPLRVDNDAPAPPVNLTAPAATSTTNGFSASWSLPPDSGTPIVGARYQVCEPVCGPVLDAPSTTGISTISLPTEGTATLRVWLVDQAGHEDPARAATLALTYAPPVDPPPPGPPPPTTTTTPTPPPVVTNPLPPPAPRAAVKGDAKLKITTLRRKGRTVTVAGTLTAKASGRVTIRYLVRSHGKSHTLTKRVTIRRHAFRTTLRLSPTYARQRTATVTVSYAGDSDTKAQARTTTLHTRA